jgi:hypothetical protein
MGPNGTFLTNFLRPLLYYCLGGPGSLVEKRGRRILSSRFFELLPLTPLCKWVYGCWLGVRPIKAKVHIFTTYKKTHIIRNKTYK